MKAAQPAGDFQGFSKDGIAFLRELKSNNSTAWFHANKARYEKSLKIPALRFLPALIEGLKKTLPEIKDGRLMRINRDIRFSRDKSPYKTHISLMLWDDTKKSQGAPHLYFHLEPGNLILADGHYEFDAPYLDSFRRAITHPKKGKEFSAIMKKLTMLDVGGKHWKRTPRGFDGAHPNAEYLLYKGLVVGVETPVPKEAFGPGFVKFCVDRYKAMVPFHRWMSEL